MQNLIGKQLRNEARIKIIRQRKNKFTNSYGVSK